MLRQVKIQGRLVEYTLIQTARSSVEIKVLPDEIKLFAPPSFPLRQADQFIRDKIDWIRTAQGRLEGYKAAERAEYPMTDGMPVPVEGRNYALRVVKSAENRGYIAGDDLVVMAKDPSPEAVSDILRDFLIARATERISERVKYYTPLIGRAPGRVTIREQRTKWGSCSSQGNLNFNWKLIMAPSEALDYVVIHELCHLYDFNHSPAFWKRVGQYQPEYAVWRDFLRSGWAHPFR